MKHPETPSALDRYVRLRNAAFQALRPVHRFSEVEHRSGDLDRESSLDRQPVPIQGYSEWSTQREPAVTLGWDWTWYPTGEIAMNVHSLRTNLMLVGDDGIDLGHARTLDAVLALVRALGWPEVVREALRDVG